MSVVCNDYTCANRNSFDQCRLSACVKIFDNSSIAYLPNSDSGIAVYDETIPDTLSEKELLLNKKIERLEMENLNLKTENDYYVKYIEFLENKLK